LLGFTLCFSWLGYLRTIKKSIDQKYALIFVMEKYLPVPVFQVLLQKTERDENKNSLTIREMFVPIAFLLGYIFFGILLIFFNS